VEEGLGVWVGSGLEAKQVEKLVVLVYYMEEKGVYVENGIRIDYGRFDKERLGECIKGIFGWQSFNYVKGVLTRDKIH
jgi:hypothetical protein